MYCCEAGSAAEDATIIVYSIAPASVSTYHLRQRRALLPDAAVNANHVAALLVDDRVQNDRGLSGLAVADDQLPLPAPNRNHRIDGLNARLQRLPHRLPVQNPRRQ